MLGIQMSESIFKFLVDLSSFLGALSLGCWVVLLIPQLLENYKNQSSDSISPLFLIMWLVGDIFNIFGSIWGNVSSTVLVLAVYYIGADFFLLLQVYYYRWKAFRKSKQEHEPLLQSRSLEEGLHEPLDKNLIWWDRLSFRGQFGFMACVVLITTFIGNVLISNASSDKPDDQVNKWPFIAGCTSSILYFFARFPQIIKNYKSKSTDGLSIIFFILSMLGNTAYTLSILVYPAFDYTKYFRTNIPWIFGAFSTIFLDIFIFYQFLLYRHHSHF
ncbi:G-protein coupled receptor Stm1 [Schizosaccharomyces octosporus yFS286]|uniref:G-protein coupled receptor Stm1 n=1 Tax=Schizosaccharomyces octosporus (strain yFS286) TaxID=483514 RepID=S9QWQ1_SCHOY|nr:G-protein coupled receptor Stm1 [Schizosaccharomyces octosporus yFS286]EPX70740.1 G-protein coupled receptor Stm1 [Schizosaccharomyces octosporus yFS286]